MLVGYITPAASGVHNASEQGTKSAMAHKWDGWLYHVPPGASETLESGVQN